jgi:hypothetical protein
VTPAAILFCTTIVTAVPHGSIAQHDCRFLEPPFTGTKATVLDVPVHNDTHANVVLPIAQTAAPIADAAAPIAKPVVKTAKLYKSKMRRRVAHLTTFRRIGKYVVSPTASEISNKKERYSFWEEIKRFDPFK